MNYKLLRKEGLPVTCIINGKYISDGKLHWNINYWKEKCWFVCQNEVESSGYHAEDHLGYKYAYQIENYGSPEGDVKNIKIRKEK
jgi:hypothetical protein